MVGVAQLVRVPDCDSGCRGFDPRRPPQFVSRRHETARNTRNNAKQRDSPRDTRLPTPDRAPRTDPFITTQRTETAHSEEQAAWRIAVAQVSVRADSDRDRETSSSGAASSIRRPPARRTSEERSMGRPDRRRGSGEHRRGVARAVPPSLRRAAKTFVLPADSRHES